MSSFFCTASAVQIIFLLIIFFKILFSDFSSIPVVVYLKVSKVKRNEFMFCLIFIQHYPNEIFHQETIETYIREAAKLAWKMIVQRPQMAYSVEGEFFFDCTHFID